MFNGRGTKDRKSKLMPCESYLYLWVGITSGIITLLYLMKRKLQEST